MEVSLGAGGVRQLRGRHGVSVTNGTKTARPGGKAPLQRCMVTSCSTFQAERRLHRRRAVHAQFSDDNVQCQFSRQSGCGKQHRRAEASTVVPSEHGQSSSRIRCMRRRGSGRGLLFKRQQVHLLGNCTQKWGSPLSPCLLLLSLPRYPGSLLCFIPVALRCVLTYAGGYRAAVLWCSDGFIPGLHLLNRGFVCKTGSGPESTESV